jgi:hypothetical protein
MATAAAAPSTSSLKKKVVWSLQSNPYAYNDEEKKEWKYYSDFEIEAIEKGYEEKKDTVDLGDYVIDLNRMVQINKLNRQESTVKREEVDSKQCLQAERFSFDETPWELSTNGGWNPEFIIKWEQRFEKLVKRPFRYEEMLPEIVEQAANGMIPYLFAIQSELTVLCL